MRVIRDRGDVRWLPSRFTFAFFRVVALIRLLATSRQQTRGVILALDPGQSAGEQYSVGILVMAVVTSLLTFLYSGWIPTAAAVPLALVTAPWLLQIPTYVVGTLLPPPRNNQRITSILTLSIVIVAASFAAAQPTWVRFPAVAMLAAAALNLVSAAILFPFRNRIARLESQRCEP